MDIKTLTTEEIQTLQVDAALRLLGGYTQDLVALNEGIVSALKDKLSAESRLCELKQTKSVIINNMRAMQSIAKSS